MHVVSEIVVVSTSCRIVVSGMRVKYIFLSELVW